MVLQVGLGKQLKEILNMPDTVKLGFMAHSDAKRDDKRAKDRYTVSNGAKFFGGGGKNRAAAISTQAASEGLSACR